VADQAFALHFARFYRTRFEFEHRLSASGKAWSGGRRYSRWGALYRGLKACRLGARVRSHDDLQDLLGPLSATARLREVLQMTEFFLIDFDRQAVIAGRTF